MHSVRRSVGYGIFNFRLELSDPSTNVIVKVALDILVSVELGLHSYEEFLQRNGAVLTRKLLLQEKKSGARPQTWLYSLHKKRLGFHLQYHVTNSEPIRTDKI